MKKVNEEMNLKKVPIDKKLRLAQSIRQENLDNRMKIRQRERLLYGTDSVQPLWEKGGYLHTGVESGMYAGVDAAVNNPEEAAPDAIGSFKFRMTAAIFLFIGFLLCDAGQYKIFGYSMNELYGMISEDYFQMNDAENAEKFPQLTELLKLDLFDQIG